MDKRKNKAFKMEPEELLQTLDPHVSTAAFEAHKKALEDGVAYLILHDFERLLRLLYTVDVDERVLKDLLQLQPQPDAAAVTELLIQRQLKKIETRQQFKSDAKPPEEEAW